MQDIYDSAQQQPSNHDDPTPNNDWCGPKGSLPQENGNRPEPDIRLQVPDAPLPLSVTNRKLTSQDETSEDQREVSRHTNLWLITHPGEDQPT